MISLCANFFGIMTLKLPAGRRDHAGIAPAIGKLRRAMIAACTDRRHSDAACPPASQIADEDMLRRGKEPTANGSGAISNMRMRDSLS